MTKVRFVFRSTLPNEFAGTQYGSAGGRGVRYGEFLGAKGVIAHEFREEYVETTCDPWNLPMLRSDLLDFLKNPTYKGVSEELTIDHVSIVSVVIGREKLPLGIFGDNPIKVSIVSFGNDQVKVSVTAPDIDSFLSTWEALVSGTWKPGKKK